MSDQRNPLSSRQPPPTSPPKGGKGEGKGGRKGAHPGRGEYSRHAGYSEPTSGATPSAHFQESVPQCQAKGVPPEVPAPTPGKATESSRTAGTTPEFIPTALSRLSPAELAEERKRAEAFNAFLDAFHTPPPQPAAPSPAPVSSTWMPRLPGSQGTATPVANPPDKGEADASARAPAPGTKRAPSAAAEGKASAAGSYPPFHQSSAVTSLERSSPPPPPPMALVGRHVTVHGSDLPSIEGKSGYVLEYDPVRRAVPCPA